MTATAAHNPFRVRCVEALGYLPQGETWDTFLARCAAMKFRGAVVGPHGSGKTTLLCDLAHRLRDRGERVTALFTNRDVGSRLPAAWRGVDDTTIVLADGYDTLNPLARAWLRRRTRRLIVTAHRACTLPTLVRTEAQPEVLCQLVAALRDDLMPIAEATRRLRDHGGNMREAFRALYDEAARHQDVQRSTTSVSG